MRAADRFVNAAERALVALLCRVDDADIRRVPLEGPLILVTNHVNFLEIPVVRSRLRPRRVVALAKAEAWEQPILGWLFDLWGAIPVRRGEADLRALRASLEALRRRDILVVAPEGTRSRDGILRRGRPGVVTLGARSGAPLLPLAFFGGEQLGTHLRRLRRTPFSIRVGEPFCIAPHATRLPREERQVAADEVMTRLAALLPPPYRGVYSDLTGPVRYLHSCSLEEGMQR
ncbi:MAG: lysophospholipid acyltransferase family protein [Candidatus Bipolaricaulota bacterium]